MSVREILALILVLTMAMPVAAQDAASSAQVATAAQAGGMAVEDLRVTVSKSLVIDYPADISRISTSNPEVVDAVPATSREFLLHGKGHGSATVVVWAKNGLRTMYNVTVEHNLEPIKRLLKETFPSENIGIVAGRDSITLIGTVSGKDVADRALAIATPLAKTVVSNLSLATAPISKQIVLKVRFAELDRTAAQQFGVNLVSTGAGNTIGSVSTQQFSPPSVSTDKKLSITDALNIFAFRKDLNLAALVKALQTQGVLQILAEPNLVTTNGKEASFLVGGEFPVPVLQGGSNAGAVTIQFREFGIRLLFNPVITENNTIKLYVKPEVSTIDLANAVTFSGFTIPALATRRMETNIELGFGQSFVIAGLIDDRVTEQFNKLPGLANIPILGALFRSRTENRSKSELVIIVTPEVATPINSGDPKPEPAWLRPFMPQQHPGDKVGSDIVPGTGGAVVPPLLPGRSQVDHESVGNGAKAHPVTPAAPNKPKAEAKPKNELKTEADSGKRSRLKVWGRKAKPVQKTEDFRFTPVGERPLAPAIEPASRVTATKAKSKRVLKSESSGAANAVVQEPAPSSRASAPRVVDVSPKEESALPAAEAASAPEAPSPTPAVVVPAPAIPASTTLAPLTPQIVPGETAPAAGVAPVPEPISAKPTEADRIPPAAAAPAAKPDAPAIRLSPEAAPAAESGQPKRTGVEHNEPPTVTPSRRLSAGITSLPQQVLGSQPSTAPRAATTPGAPGRGGNPGEQH